MRNLRGTYVHRGDAARRRKRFKRVLLLAASAASLAVVGGIRMLGTASAEVAPRAPSSFGLNLGSRRELKEELETTQGELSLVRAQFQRADRIIHYSTRYEIPANMAGYVLDAALGEGIDPELAFRLVKLESDFNPRAMSPVGAVGLTQLMVPTAKFFDRTISKEKLYEPRTNLRIGFRYLRALIEEYHGDAKLALLVYNRGEVAVKNAIHAGVDPSNGYDRLLTKGYKGTGVIN
jgi:transglycosylase-like protein with SLT domain